jgi:SAM-dependent methyltransferase
MSEELQKQYALRFEQLEEYRRGVWQVLCEEFFSQWIPENAVILDLGCGWGEFINQIKAARKLGMDLNPDSCSKLGHEVTFLKQDCAQVWDLPDEQLDVVFTSNFFEHLPSKTALRQTVDQAIRCLKPGGRLICLGPNIRFLPGEYWDFWDHHLPLSDASLVELLRLAGFIIDEKFGRFLPYSMSQGSTPPLIFLRVFLKCRFLWPVFGKQFLVIGHKPTSPDAF